MENKHIQNNRNEDNKENDTTKKIGKIHIQENEYIKNRNNFYNQEDIQGNVHYDSTHKEGHSHKHEELSEHQHIGKSEKSSVNQHTHTHVDAAVKSLSRVILKEHMSTCIVDAIKTGDDEAIEALNDAIDKFMK